MSLDNLSMAWRIIAAWQSVFGVYAQAAFVVACIIVIVIMWRLLLLLQQSGSLLFDLAMLTAFIVLGQIVEPSQRIYVYAVLAVLIGLRIATAVRVLRSPPQSNAGGQ